MATKSKKQEPEKQESKDMVPAIPDYVKAAQQQSAADTGALVAASISVPRLSYRGKRWRFIVDGEEELVKELAVKVAIVGVEPDAGRFIKTMYLNTYAPGDSAPPDCSSSNGIAPDVWVSTPQAQRCNQCPKNIFGSATSRTGGKAKACHDSKRLWVVKPNDMEIVYGLNVPVMSLKNLAEYGKFIAKNNYPLALVITELAMDDESEFPKLTFKCVGFIAEKMSGMAIELNQRRPWKMNIAPMIPYDAPMAALPAPEKAVEAVPVRKTGGENIDKIVGDWTK